MLNFEDYLEREYAKAGASTSFTFVYIPATGGTKAGFTILNAGAADVKTKWECYADKVRQLPTFDASYGTPTTTTTE